MEDVELAIPPAYRSIRYVSALILTLTRSWSHLSPPTENSTCWLLTVSWRDTNKPEFYRLGDELTVRRMSEGF